MRADEDPRQDLDDDDRNADAPRDVDDERRRRRDDRDHEQAEELRVHVDGVGCPASRFEAGARGSEPALARAPFCAKECPPCRGTVSHGADASDALVTRARLGRARHVRAARDRLGSGSSTDRPREPEPPFSRRSCCRAAARRDRGGHDRVHGHRLLDQPDRVAVLEHGVLDEADAVAPQTPLTGHAFGVFSATFVYALVALAAVGRNEDVDLGSTVAFSLMLLLASVLLFLLLLYSTLRQMNLSYVLSLIGDRGREVIEAFYGPPGHRRRHRGRDLDGPAVESGRVRLRGSAARSRGRRLQTTRRSSRREPRPRS